MKTKTKTICGILLYDDAYEILSSALEPYIQKGRIGKFIYGTKAQDDGVFLNITVTPELVNGRIKDEMEISIPLRHIKFVVASTSKDFIGFA